MKTRPQPRHLTSPIFPDRSQNTSEPIQCPGSGNILHDVELQRGHSLRLSVSASIEFTSESLLRKMLLLDRNFFRELVERHNIRTGDGYRRKNQEILARVGGHTSVVCGCCSEVSNDQFVRLHETAFLISCDPLFRLALTKHQCHGARSSRPGKSR